MSKRVEEYKSTRVQKYKGTKNLDTGSLGAWHAASLQTQNLTTLEKVLEIDQH